MKICVFPMATAAAFLIVGAGCGRDDVKVYKIASNDTMVASAPMPANQTAMPMAMPGGMNIPDNSAAQPQLKYTLPEGWKEKALTQLRVASFEVADGGKTADVSVIPLSGMAGGDLANVNRWRGQVSQPPIAEEELAKLAEKIEIAGTPSELFDIPGTSPSSGAAVRILGGILHAGDTAWYFKMMGDVDLVEKQKIIFTAFLKSVDFNKVPAPSTMDLSKLPASHPALPNMTATDPNAPSADTKPTWTVPADWKEGELAQFLVARFVIQGNGDATAAVNISQLAGEGGGLAANVNRWRKQLGQEPIAEDVVAKLPTIDASGVKATLVEIAGTDARTGKAASLVGVVLPLNGQTWFYKLMGDASIVTQQKDVFIQFIQSAKYPAAQ